VNKTLANFILLLSLLIIQVKAFSDHITVSGDVSGEWNTDTVMVIGDLTVPDGQLLVIRPGTIVEFQGSFAVYVEGSVFAQGELNNSIIFQISDTTGFSVDSIPDGGWRGIRFDNNRLSNEESVFLNCSFYFGKSVGIDPQEGNGGAVYINHYNKVSFYGCLFQDNFATYNGGAIYLDSADISITHSTFAHNRCGPAIAPYGYGGAICSDYSNPDIRWNVFDSNISTGVGGGLAVRFKDCNLYNNIFRSNTSGLGGGFGFLHIAEISHRIANNLVAGNFAVYFGGGVANLVASPIYINNTIVYNQAMYGGGFYCKDSVAPVFYNTIIWGNTAGVGPQGYLFEIYSQADFFNCDVEGGPALFGGSGGGTAFAGAFEQCLDTIPGFLDSGEHPYALNENSPCIDAGLPDTTGLMLPETDLAGNPRIMYGIIDMGAYEWSTVGVKDEYGDNSDVRVWPNPFIDHINVELTLDEGEQLLIEIYDLTGRKVAESNFREPFCGKHQFIIKVKDSESPGGVYLLNIFLGNEVICKKLINSLY
jgi:predicted outer membrane repeat protein